MMATQQEDLFKTEIFSEITGVNKDLIKRLYVILQVISCNMKIKIENYEMYCLNTAKLYCI